MAHFSKPLQLARLSPTFAKSQEVFRLTGQRLLHEFGAHNILVVTLTFAERITSTAEAHRRLNSLLNPFRRRYAAYLWCLEPHTSGTIHYHLLLPTKHDVYEGTYIRGFERRQEASAKQLRKFMNPALRAESDWIQVTVQRYGFGRSTVAPIYSEDPIAIVNYMAKCKWRFHPLPFDEKKYIRWWNSSKNIRAGTIRFSWLDKNSVAYRAKLRQWTIASLNVAPHDTARIRQIDENPFVEAQRGLGSLWFLSFKSWIGAGEPPITNPCGQSAAHTAISSQVAL